MGTGGGATGSNAMQVKTPTCTLTEVLESPVTTVNRAVGIQGRLEDSQERLDDSRERPHREWTASYPTH